MATPKERKAAAAQQRRQAAAEREPEQQRRRRPTPDPSAVAQSFAYAPAASYARAPELGGTNQALAGVEGGASGPGGTTAAAADVVPAGGTAAGTGTGTAATGTGTGA